MKYVSNKSTITVKYALAFCLLSALLAAGVSIVRSTSAATNTNRIHQAFATLAGVFQAGEPEQEPNETMAQATPISVPGKRLGTAKFGDAASYEYTYSGGQKDKIEDFFTFTVPTGQTLRLGITLTYSNAATDLDLFLFKKTGTEANPTLTAKGVSNGSTLSEHLSSPADFPDLDAGTYFIGVSAFDSANNSTSLSYTLTTQLDAVAPPPTITRIVPDSASAGTGPFSLTVTGTNFFDQQSTVRWNGQPRTTVFITNTQLVAFLTAADVSTPGIYPVSVTNPPTLGGQSNAVPFTVTSTDISPEVEPNETPNDATLLLAPGKRNGNIAVGDTSVMSVQFPGGASDPVEDLYAVTLTQSSRLDLFLVGANGQANLALYLMKEKSGAADLESLGNSRLSGNIQRITTSAMLAPGRYLVGVSAVSGASSYTIEAKVPGNRLLQVMTNSAAPGSTVTVPISFYSEGNENSLNFSLKFDPTLLSNPQVALGSDTSTGTANVNTSQTGQGHVGVQLALQQGQYFGTGTREIAKVTFTIKANPGVGATVVEFGDDPVVRGIVDASGNAVVGTYAAGNVIITPGLEGDVSPRALGNGSISVADWAQVGRFVSGLDTPADGSEFQRADCAPKNTLGDGKLTIADWVMAGRYASGLETPVAAGGVSTAIAAITFDKDFAGRETSSPDEEQQTRTIRVVPTTFNRGQQNVLVIELNSLGNENAIGFSVNFDTTQLNFVSATLGADAQGAAFNINTGQISQGRVGIGLALSSGQTIAAGARQIVMLTFNVPASNSVNSTTISFADQPIAREVVDATANVLPTTFTPDVITFQPQINQTPSLTTVTPGTVNVGGNNFTITINGTNFVNGAVARVTVNGVTAERQTNFVSSTQLTATLLAQDIAETNTISISVQNPQPGGGTSNSLSINVTNPTPVITTISPNSAAQNSQGFLLTVNGSNFVPGAMVQLNGVNKVTTFVSSTQLRAQIPASDLNTVGTPSVTVVNPAPGGGASNAVTFTIAAPSGIPRITTISPATVQTDNPGFPLTVNGSNFVQSSVVRINGDSLPTTFVSSTQLTAQVAAADIANAGNASITVFTPPPGGGTSNAAILTITTPPNPKPEITALSPNPVTSGGPAFALTVTGTGFVSSSVVRLNNQDRATQFISATELRATISATDITSGGTAVITVVSPTPGGGTSNAATLTISFAPPVITLLSPSSGVAGGPAFQLTVTGTNFAPGSVVRWNGVDRPTTVDNTTQVTAQIPASDIASAGTATITVFSPAPGAGLSNAVTFTITEAARPLPRIISINPANALVGSAAITLTVTGTNFVTDSVVRWNGQARPTTFVNSTQLTAQIPASDLAAAGSALVTVFTPPAGGGESNTLTFAITLPPNPTPTITSIAPATIGAGTGAFALTVNGTGFVAGSVVQFNGANRPTTFVSDTKLIAQISAEDIASAGTVAIRVVSPAPGGGTSNDAVLTIVNPPPVITTINPSVVAKGSSGFTLTVNGTGFVQGAQIAVNGVTRLTTFVNNTQVAAQITAAEVANVGSLNIQVINPAPGGGSSNVIALPIRDRSPLPRLIALSPDTVLAGGPGFTLVITGTGFSSDSVVRVNGTDRITDFVSETTLAAQITAADVAAGAALTINVFNPPPGGGMSNPLTLNVNNPVPRITSISPDAAAAGGGAFTMVVSGVNFVANSVVRFNGIDVPTTFVTNSQLTAAIPASLLAGAGIAPVTVFNPPPAGGTSNAVNFSLSNPAPAISSINPTQVMAGAGAITLTINGSGFVPGSIVRVNNT
ncbi:MAG: IPT/TIG domain-containing protein, partial [Blastocatellia bacterium]